jgi:acyl carrier protein
MNGQGVDEVVAQVINRVLVESGRPSRQLRADDTLTGTLALDSLDLAVLVVGLEQALGVDPFRQGAHPVRTYRELVELYTSTLDATSSGSDQ